MIITTDKTMRPRDKWDHYPTPLALCEAALNLLPRFIVPFPATSDELIVDPGAGTGVWGKAARRCWPCAQLEGCDIRDLPAPPEYDAWYPKTDFLATTLPAEADLVMGNPPYALAEQFVRKALASTRDNGYVLFLLRLAFLEGQARARGLWAEFPPQSVHVLSARPSFIPEGDKAGKTDATAYAVFIWKKGHESVPALNWLDWRGDSAQPATTQAALEFR